MATGDTKLKIIVGVKSLGSPPRAPLIISVELHFIYVLLEEWLFSAERGRYMYYSVWRERGVGSRAVLVQGSLSGHVSQWDTRHNAHPFPESVERKYV